MNESTLTKCWIRVVPVWKFVLIAVKKHKNLHIWTSYFKKLGVMPLDPILGRGLNPHYKLDQLALAWLVVCSPNLKRLASVVRTEAYKFKMVSRNVGLFRIRWNGVVQSNSRSLMSLQTVPFDSLVYMWLPASLLCPYSHIFVKSIRFLIAYLTCVCRLCSNVITCFNVLRRTQQCFQSLF